MGRLCLCVADYRTLTDMPSVLPNPHPRGSDPITNPRPPIRRVAQHTPPPTCRQEAGSRSGRIRTASWKELHPRRHAQKTLFLRQMVIPVVESMYNSGEKSIITATGSDTEAYYRNASDMSSGWLYHDNLSKPTVSVSGVTLSYAAPHSVLQLKR